MGKRKNKNRVDDCDILFGSRPSGSTGVDAHPAKKGKNVPATGNPQPTVSEDATRNGDIVDVVKASDSPTLIGDSQDVLSDLVSPIPLPDFLSTYWRKKALVVHPTVPELSQRVSDTLVEDGMFGLDLEQLLNNSSSENIHVWMKPLSEGRITSFETTPQAATTVWDATATGMSLYFRAPPEVEKALVEAVSDDLGLSFSGYYPEGQAKGEVETFMARKGNITDWHFDFMENWTIQLAGSKKWKLAHSNITHPLRGATPHYANIDTIEQQRKIHQQQRPEFELDPVPREELDRSCEEVTLHEGSVMYFPAGMWHRVECEEDSLSINISIIPQSWAEHFSNGIMHLLLGKEEFREGICFQSREEALVKVRRLHAMLGDILKKEMKPEDLLPGTLFHDVRELRVAKDKEVPPEAQAEREAMFKNGFRKNPLVELVRAHEPETTWSEYNEGKDEDKEDDGKEKDAVKTAGSDGETIKYAIHTMFGTSDVTSTRRNGVTMPIKFETVAEWIRKQKSTFSFDDVVAHKADASVEDVTRLLCLMKDQGLLQVL